MRQHFWVPGFTFSNEVWRAEGAPPSRFAWLETDFLLCAVIPVFRQIHYLSMWSPTWPEISISSGCCLWDIISQQEETGSQWPSRRRAINVIDWPQWYKRAMLSHNFLKYIYNSKFIWAFWQTFLYADPVWQLLLPHIFECFDITKVHFYSATRCVLPITIA